MISEVFYRDANVDVWRPVMSLEENIRGNAEVAGVRPRRRQATEGLINVRGERRAWHLGVNKSKSVSLPVYGKQERYPSCLIHAPPSTPTPSPPTSYCSVASGSVLSAALTCLFHAEFLVSLSAVVLRSFGYKKILKCHNQRIRRPHHRPADTSDWR